jgi:hypothetical protein
MLLFTLLDAHIKWLHHEEVQYRMREHPFRKNTICDSPCCRRPAEECLLLLDADGVPVETVMVVFS